MVKRGFPKIPGYRITEKLGEGGMATVYLGIQEKLNRNVAIKILDPALLKNSQIAARFLIEAETAAGLYHTNIISIYDIGHTAEHQYIVQEFLKETLKDRLMGYPGFRFQPAEAFAVLKPIAGALDHAHAHNIIHRDIKTENIMFRGDGTPVLMDFGIARALDSDSSMTRTGISLGTPYYMSPEQCKAQKLDGRSDFYSLGVVLFEILTGEKPYTADNPTAVALRHIQDPVPKLPVEWGLAPYQVLIDKMMAKDRSDRIANGAELITLMDTLSNAPVSSKTTVLQTSEIHAPAEEELAFEIGDEGFDLLEHPLQETDLHPPDSSSDKTQLGVFSPTPSPAVATPSKAAVIHTGGTEELDEDDEFNIFDEAIKTSDKTSESNQPAEPGVTSKVKPVTVRYSIKLVIESIVFAGLLMIIFIIFYNLGQETHETPSNLNDAAVIRHQREVSKLIDDQYRKDLASAGQSIANGDLENAAAIIAQLKNKAQSPELKELEDRYNDAISYRDYFNSANDFYANRSYVKAMESLVLARGIKTTPELESLEKRIQAALDRRKNASRATSARQRELMAADDQAFAQAAAENSIDSYRKYLDKNPSGHHVDDAIARISKIREEFRLRQEARLKAAIPKTNLRSSYKSLNYSLAEAMIRGFSFFDNGFNKSGDFKNYYKKLNNGSDSMIIDQGTRLMWYDGKSSKALNFRKADRWVRYLNRRKYGGFSDWRLPTLEEAASLLESRKSSDGLHISPIFRSRPKNCWTGDSLRLQTKWVVRFNTGTIFADSDRSKQYVIAVRSNR